MPMNAPAGCVRAAASVIFLLFGDNPLTNAAGFTIIMTAPLEIIRSGRKKGRLAQLVEHSLDVRRVSGSSPLTSTKIALRPLGRARFFMYSKGPMALLFRNAVKHFISGLRKQTARVKRFESVNVQTCGQQFVMSCWPLFRCTARPSTASYLHRPFRPAVSNSR